VVRTWGDLVCLVYLVHFVRPVGEPDEPDKRDEPNKPERPDRPNIGILCRRMCRGCVELWLMLQFVTHSTQKIRHTKGLLEGLPCPEEFRDTQGMR